MRTRVASYLRKFSSHKSRPCATDGEAEAEGPCPREAGTATDKSTEVDIAESMVSQRTTFKVKIREQAYSGEEKTTTEVILYTSFADNNHHRNSFCIISGVIHRSDAYDTLILISKHLMVVINTERNV